MRGVRARLTVTFVALVALTAVLLGAGAYLFVETSLHQQVLRDAEGQARFDLSVTVPGVGLPAGATRDHVVDSHLLEILLQREVRATIELQNGETASTEGLEGVAAALPVAFRGRVTSGELAFAWTSVNGVPSLVVGGRVPAAGPTVYFVRDVSALEEALVPLRLALLAGTVILVLIALLMARRLARGVLAPVEAAGRAAERIERGDLTARVPVTSNDEFGAWADRFNRMAAALAETIGRLEAAEAQNRRFVADVAHELRTPVAALVAEASILRDQLDTMPPESRRTAELLVSDIGRLRSLVDDLMEVSRFDAGAERVALEPVDLGRLTRTVAAARLPEATFSLPEEPIILETDPRRLERILGNLLDNAREHAAGAPVEVTLTTESDAVVISVADRGPGVPSDRIGRIFERFYKADPSRHGGSSGLGLAIAAEHAALLGGELTATGHPDGGLRIELRMPVTGSLPRGDEIVISHRDAGTPISDHKEAQP